MYKVLPTKELKIKYENISKNKDLNSFGYYPAPNWVVAEKETPSEKEFKENMKKSA